MWKYKKSSKEGRKNDPGLQKGVVSTSLEDLELISLLQGSTEESCNFSHHHKPACGRGQNHVCNKLLSAGDIEHLDDELHIHLARWKQTCWVWALAPARMVLRGPLLPLA